MSAFLIKKISKQTQIAVLFWRLGPYHHARLHAAGKLMEIFGVEACGMEDTYAWQKVDGADSFKKITLSERELNSRGWKKELSRNIWCALNEIKPPAVVIPGWSSPDALSALAWCIQTNTPAAIMSDSTVWDERRVKWKEWIKGRIVKMCSAGLVAGTHHADYMAKLGMPRGRISLGYDVVDNDYFAANAAEFRNQKVKNRKQFGLPEGYFLASARFVEKKNLPRLIQAYDRYRELARNPESKHQKVEIRNRKIESTSPKPSPQDEGKVTPWDLVLLGDGPLKSDLCRLISDLSLQDSVRLPGFKQYGELPAYYGLASTFVHVSTVDQWGLVVNEAMASGLPVLVSNRCGCATDLVQEGRNGFTFDPCNVEELAQLMLKISAFNFPLSEFGSASREIISHWGTERFARGLQQAVEVALDNPPPRARMLDRLLLRLLLMR